MSHQILEHPVFRVILAYELVPHEEKERAYNNSHFDDADEKLDSLRNAQSAK